MPLEPPRWWDEGVRAWQPRLLSPLAALYGSLAGARMLRPPAYVSRLPVICVGNLTLGGAGKTPLTIHLLERLLAVGQRPVALSRGYGGKRTGPHLIDPDVDDAEAVGDEPLLLARAAPTVIARDRAAGARLIERLPLPDSASTGPVPPVSASCIVMDDGLQNPALAKTLRIAVVDPQRRIGNARVFPAGPLRAPLAIQLATIDAVLLHHGSPPRNGVAPEISVPEWLRSFGGPVLHSIIAPGRLPDSVARGPIVAFAGIAVPEKLFATLEALGLNVVQKVGFPDHHRFTERDLNHLLALAQDHGAHLVTTQKDEVRINHVPGSGSFRQRCTALPVSLHFETADMETLDRMVLGAIGGHVAA